MTDHNIKKYKFDKDHANELAVNSKKDIFQQKNEYIDESVFDRLREEKGMSSKNMLLETVFSRLGNLRNANREYNNYNTKSKNYVSVERRYFLQKQKKNMENYTNIINQLNYIFDTVDNVKTTSFGSLNLRESFLNSGRDFPSEYNYSEYYKKSFLDVIFFKFRK
jgi:hypothetical protein